MHTHSGHTASCRAAVSGSQPSETRNSAARTPLRYQAICAGRPAGVRILQKLCCNTVQAPAEVCMVRLLSQSCRQASDSSTLGFMDMCAGRRRQPNARLGGERHANAAARGVDGGCGAGGCSVAHRNACSQGCAHCAAVRWTVASGNQRASSKLPLALTPGLGRPQERQPFSFRVQGCGRGLVCRETVQAQAGRRFRQPL